MNRTQKKCLVVTAGCHLLLLVILFLGPAFFWHKPAPDDLPVLKIVPSSAIIEALTTGVAHPHQPQSAPPQPAPPPSQPVETHPEPVQPDVQPPVQQPVHHVEPKTDDPPPPDDTPSADPTPTPKPKPKPKSPDIQVDLTQVVVNPKRHSNAAARAHAQAEERAERAAQEQREEALQNLTSSLRDNLSSSTEVQIQGASAHSAANYGQIVKSIYYDAWNLPDSADDDEASPRVHIVIARDGTVISAHITESSGNAAVDASVQSALDRVRTIQPFPAGMNEDEHSYNIKFDLKAKRSL